MRSGKGMLVMAWLWRVQVSDFDNLTAMQITTLQLPQIYKLLETAAAHSNFTKFLRWPLVSDE